MHSVLASVYSERIENYILTQQKIAKRLRVISFLRLLLFLAFAWFLYSAFKERFQQHSLLYAILTIPGFLFLVVLANRYKTSNDYIGQLIRVNENEINTGAGKSSFFDDGANFSPAKGFTVDLNIFGSGSLFHLLNRAGSKTGKEKIGERLSAPFLNPIDILNYQAGVTELSKKIDFRQDLLALTLLLKEEETLNQLRAGIDEEDFSEIKGRFWSVLAIAWPLMGIGITVYSIFADRLQFMLAFIVLGLLLLSFVLKKLSHLYNHISKRTYLYGQYAKCFELISSQHFEHPYLLKKKNAIEEAAYAFKRLSKLTGLFDLRMSMLSFIINGLFLADLLCAREYLRWNKKYQPQMDTWFDTLGEIELLNSLATFYYNHPAFIFPEPINDKTYINAQEMGHPLMDETVAIVNNISIGEPEKLHLITGSNMSGKSTFLRTLGLNMILAQIGAPVFARTFVFSPVQFLTSFHHIDSLSESTSYFYAELKALQSIINALDQPVPSLVLLDEVMRGTNSKDKHDGTALLIKKILKFSCLTLIATHDTELGILAEDHPGSIQNFCFESELSDKGLTFDFKKRKGVAQTTNATYLMQQMGII